jgi:glutamyl-tRNA reductase
MCDTAGDTPLATKPDQNIDGSLDEARRDALATIEGRAREIERRELDRALQAMERRGNLDDDEREPVMELATGLVDGLLAPVDATLDQPAEDHEIETELGLFGE